MRIVVFGASGRTGRHVGEQVLARGHEVTAFVRDASRLDVRKRLQVAQGDARDAAAVDRAITHHDAVISTLALMSPEPSTEHSHATRTIVDAKAPGRSFGEDFATFVLDALERDEWIGHVIGPSAEPLA